LAAQVESLRSGGGHESDFLIVLISAT